MSQRRLLDTLKQLYSRLRDNVVEAAMALWIARVSTISVIIGAVLFIAIPQVQDTFLEVRATNALGLNFWYWLAFLCLAVVFWALPVHYAARRNLTHDLRYDAFFRDRAGPSDGDRRGVGWWEKWIPRVLGFACFASIAIGAGLSRNGARVNEYSGTINIQTYLILVAAFIFGACFLLFAKYRTRVFGWLDQRVGTWLFAALLISFIAFLLLPIEVLDLPRAWLIPVLLGGWIPLLALLAYWGRLHRAPYILLLFLLMEVAAVWLTNHDVRILRALPDSTFSREAELTDQQRATLAHAIDNWKGIERPTLDDAIDKWKRINCSDGNCPRPILVAASGGASRAGFFTAAILGDLIDRTRGVPGHSDFQNRLFAISSVSGSSTGAAFFAAALRGAEHHGPPSCHDHSALVHLKQTPRNWRECMEQLLSGDFISLTLANYVFKDAFGALDNKYLPIPDRAAVLERSWERQFCEFAGTPTCGSTDEAAQLKAPCPTVVGLRAPFLKVAALTGRDSNDWFPLLFFNSTDVATGRRIVISPVQAHMNSGAKSRIFVDAYDFHDLMSVNESKEGLYRDISLSTAALLSARFPIISPPGIVRDRNGKVVARVIDGGYFENFGATTARELAQRLKDAGLSPFIIAITNDTDLLVPSKKETSESSSQSPELCPATDYDPLCSEDPLTVNAESIYWFSDIRGPLSGLFGSRNAHGGQALRALSTFAGERTNFCEGADDRRTVSFVHIVVHPQYRVSRLENVFQHVPGYRRLWPGKTCRPIPIPLNWWLSKPVQVYLDEQVGKNSAAIEQVVEVMKNGTTQASAGVRGSSDGPDAPQHARSSY